MTSEVYDYVIVGAGAAGCVLAYRLSEDAGKTVLLLEAGPEDRHPMIHMPKGVGRVLSDPAHVWAFQVRGAEDSNRPPAFRVRGKTLGGSSSTNGMMYVRGQPADYDRLAEVTSPDWNWAHIARAFEAMERHPLGSAVGRGGGGPLNLSLPRGGRQPALDRLIQSANAIGLPTAEDVNTPDDAEKVGYCPQTIWRGRRQSAAAAFLKPALARANLTVKTGVLADRVVFEGVRAVGVEGLIGGEPARFEARRVILSAGALASPAILERSGIGSAARLETLGIPCLADQPEVGRNLFEHCALTLQWRLRKRVSNNPQYSGWRLGLNVLRYYGLRSGPLAEATFDVGGWFKTRPGLSRPNAQFLAAPHSIDRSKATMATEGFPGTQMVVYPLRPRSRGEIHITSRNPADLPTGALDYFADAEDRRELIDAIRYVRRLAETEPLKAIIETETRPGPQADTDDEIINAYRTLGTPGYHAAGTCRMGNDAASVVDPTTRVRGVDGLHVVDLSILPFMPSGNTFAPAVAVAWRAADLIAARRQADIRLSE